MLVRTCAFVTASGLLASGALATLTEVSGSLFRQVSARGRSGSVSSPASNTDTNSNLVFGPFIDSRVATSPDTSAMAHANQNSNITAGGPYSGTLHGDASSSGNSGGYSDATTNYGSAPSFQTTFSLAFMVDALTTGHVFGSISATKGIITGSQQSVNVQLLIGDTVGGVPQSPPPLLVQLTNTGTTPFDVMINFVPGHRYSLTASVNVSAGGVFVSGASSGSGDATFNLTVPTPGGAGLLGLAGLVALRRRR
jgi:hypothetical protein